MRELCSAGSGVGLAVPDPPLLRITLPGMYWTGGSASGGSEDCGVGPWGISTPGGFNPPGGGYVGAGISFISLPPEPIAEMAIGGEGPFVLVFFLF